ncbi:LAME_0E04368g1_1 [Lachancea meyersii CBS 8951]|uniref:LAME_0E04368g1_1 n=1 Tax=Lachancea meyersii CBS 8951 TaxID=1266667 RepID=A0A1G4JGV5_9SACH|nr:LAME_0E04368g1_1 [Lachancea meyersii CBS 8951]
MSSAILQPPFKVKAHYSWSGETRGDLGFLENDIIQVTKIKGDWFYGTLLRNSRKYGYFPNNFVTVIEEKYNEFKRSIVPETKNSVLLPSAARQSLPTPSRNADAPVFSIENRTMRREKGPSKTRSYRHTHTERLPQSYSASNLVSQNQGTPSLNHARTWQVSTASDDHKRDAVFRSYGKKLNELPPLPPIPQLKERLVAKKSQVPKSFSSNDILEAAATNTGLDARVSYQRASADFYDGYSPRDLSSGACSNVFSHSQYMTESSTSSADSLALMSDFSATSAGSFARHRFAKSFDDSMQRSQIAVEEGLIRSKNGSASPQKLNNIFKKLVIKGTDVSPSSPTGSFPKLPDLASLQLDTSHDDAHGWVEAKAHLHRAQTLNSKERHDRQMLALEENRDLVLHPQEYILDEINTNEVRHRRQPGLVDIELNCINKEYIADSIKSKAKKGGTSSIESFARQIFTSAYKSQIEILFAIFIFCTETFALVDDHGQTDFGKEPVNLSKTLHKSYCTPYESTWIFKRMANSLGIVCEIVIGFLKTPGANNMDFKYNHCWLRVLANEEWRMVDVILGNQTNPIHEYIDNCKADHADAFYFLIQPLHCIYTHVPRLYQEQHIIPIVDQTIALSLPIVFPSFFHNELKLYKFSNGLAKLHDNQIYECTISIPNDVELFSSVVVDSPSKQQHYENMDLSLVQIKHRKKERLAVVKAVLPPGTSRGVIHIHSGIKGTQTTLANVHPLSLIIPLEHVGTAKNYEFVTRVPSNGVQKVDMYIRVPQNKYLFAKNEYNFEVIQHPCDGVIYGTPAVGKLSKHALAVQAPSGKLHLMHKNDPNFEFGTWETSIAGKAMEPGIWTGLVKSDAGAGWCSFAEWKCI